MFIFSPTHLSCVVLLPFPGLLDDNAISMCSYPSLAMDTFLVVNRPLRLMESALWVSLGQIQTQPSIPLLYSRADRHCVCLRHMSQMC